MCKNPGKWFRFNEHPICSQTYICLAQSKSLFFFPVLGWNSEHTEMTSTTSWTVSASIAGWTTRNIQNQTSFSQRIQTKMSGLNFLLNFAKLKPGAELSSGRPTRTNMLESLGLFWRAKSQALCCLCNCIQGITLGQGPGFPGHY